MTQAIQGMDKLMKQLQAISDADYTPAMLDGGEVIFDEMQVLTPVDEGELKDSERLESLAKNSITFSANVEHAEFVEFGTSNQPPQSYMRAAIDNKSDEAMKVTAERANMIMKAAV